MVKKTLFVLGLLGLTALSGCVVVAPHRPYAYVDVPGPVVVVGPVVPVFGFYGGGYYHGGYGYRGGGHWR